MDVNLKESKIASSKILRYSPFMIILLSQLFSVESNYLTPWSRVLLEKLTVTQLVKKFPALYGNRRFITMSKSPPMVPILIQMNSFHNLPHYILKIHPKMIFSSRLSSSESSLPFKYPNQNFLVFLISRVCATCPANLFFLDFISLRIFSWNSDVKCAKIKQIVKIYMLYLK